MNTSIKLKFSIFLLIVSSFGLSLTSCGGHKKMPDEAAKLDSLANSLAVVEQELRAVDSAKVEATYAAIIANLSFVNENLKDSISREDAEAISNHKGTRKVFKSFNEKRSRLFAEYNVTSKQLSTLSSDLKKGLTDENKAYQYFVIEFTEANRLLGSMTDLNAKIHASMEKYELFKPKVDSLIANIEAANVSPPKKK